MGDNVHETRQRILWAAKHEFAEKGFDGSRMGSIARRAEVNQALIHYYFGTKENLYSEVLRWVFGIDFASENNVYEQLEKWSLSPQELLYAMAYITVYVHLEVVDEATHPLLAREVAEGSRFLRPILKGFLIPRMFIGEKIIASGVEQGIFETDNTLMVVLEFISFISNYAAQRTIYRDTDVYSRVYEGYDTQKFFLHILTNLFKILSPKGKVLEIPEMRRDVMDFINGVIENIRRQKESLMQSGGTFS